MTVLPDVVDELPIFPLPGITLFPGGILPLHVFEPRYRQLTRDCLVSARKWMALPMLEPGFEEEYEGRPAVKAVCGVGEVVQFKEHPDGRFDVVLRGIGRVRIDMVPASPASLLTRPESGPAALTTTRAGTTVPSASVTPVTRLSRRSIATTSAWKRKRAPSAWAACCRSRLASWGSLT